MLDDDLRSATILIVDDEPANVRLLERLLAQSGFRNTRSTTDARETTGLYAELRPDLERLFEPFFTTKPMGEGTGLGLSLSRGIIESHGGTLTVESASDAGAAFAFTLPVVPLPEGALRPATSRPAIATGARRILIVDDEPEVAGFLVDLLRLDGHEVEAAANGAEALDKLDGDRFDAILSDTRMPVLDGIGFYRELERRHPELSHRVAFMTGDTLSAEKRELLARTGAPNLAKPFALDEVQRVVQRLLEP